MNIICWIYDVKAEAYTGPYRFPTKAFAIRSFQEQVNTAGTDFNKFPEDYTLFQTAEADERTAKITELKAHISLGTAFELIEREPDLADYRPNLKEIAK